MRDLTLMARRRGIAAALAAHAALATAFMLAWSEQGRVPVLRGADLYEQLRLVQWAFVALVAPWLAARMTATERRDGWVRLSALTGEPPARLLAIRLTSIVALILAAIAAAWPAVLLAAETAGASLTRVAFDQVLLFLCASCAAVLTLHVELFVDNRLASWLLATSMSVALFAALAALGAAAPLVAVSSAIAAAVVLARRVDVRLWRLAVHGV